MLDTRTPFDVSTIEDEMSEVFKGTHDPIRTGAGAEGTLRRPIDLPHSNSIAPGPKDNSSSDPAEDAINPWHYRKHPSGIECIEITRHMNFNTGNAIKYIWRYLDKGDPVENLKKAQWYIDDEIHRLEEQR